MTPLKWPRALAAFARTLLWSWEAASAASTALNAISVRVAVAVGSDGSDVLSQPPYWRGTST